MVYMCASRMDGCLGVEVSNAVSVVCTSPGYCLSLLLPVISYCCCTSLYISTLEMENNVKD